jgi:Reverse transcriptase (RNA-dependent DNA polymerase)
MDIVTAYLYRSFDNDIYMKIYEGLKMPKAFKSKSRGMYYIKLKRSLYGLKQSGQMWYNRLNEYFIKEGYKFNVISSYIFIKRSISDFTIITVNVDDLNIIRSLEEIKKTTILLNKKFKMKDLGVRKLCIDLQIKHLHNGIFIHQSKYIQKILKYFNMDKTHHLGTSTIVRSLDIKKILIVPEKMQMQDI